MEEPRLITRTSRIKDLKRWKILKNLPEFFLLTVKYAMVPGANEGYGCLLTTFNDDVYVLGPNHNGLLLGNASIYEKPTRSDQLSSKGIVEFSLGGVHIVARPHSGGLWAWGINTEGQLGHNDMSSLSKVPVRVHGMESIVTKISTGLKHTVCLLSDGKVYAWGANRCGQVGSDTALVSSPFLVPFPRGTHVTSVACAFSSSYALTSDGKVYAWGSNNSGELGCGRGNVPLPCNTPKEIRFLTGVQIVKIAAGAQHCVALSKAGEVFAWGMNNAGQAAAGTTEIVYSPAKIRGLGVVLDVATTKLGRTSMCKAGSKVFVWGHYQTQHVAAPKETEFKEFDDLLAANDLGMVAMWDSQEGGVVVEPELRSLFTDPRLMDISFLVGGREIRACKFLVMSRCEYFAKMFQEGWKEHDITTAIPIENFDFPEFDAFIHFLHTDELKIEDRHLFNLLQLADYYRMMLLHTKTTELLRTKIRDTNVLQYYSAAITYNAEALRFDALQHIAPRFLQILDSGYIQDLDPKVCKQLLMDIKESRKTVPPRRRPAPACFSRPGPASRRGLLERDRPPLNEPVVHLAESSSDDSD